MWRPWGLSLFCHILLAATLLAQGMGSTKSAIPRTSPKTKIDLPTPALDLRDVSASTGLTAPNVYGGESRKRYILEMTGNGVAVFDFDNDGWRDVFLVTGTRLEMPPGSPRPTNRLYRNKGGGSFEDVTKAAGLERSGWGQGVCAGDYDNDGNTDLLVTYYGHNVLYRNRGNGAFEDVARGAGLPVGQQRWGTGCSFLDYNRDGHLDLFVANYLAFDLRKATEPGSSPFCFWKGVSVFCGPRGFPGEQNILYRNDGAGRFRDVSKQAGIYSPDLHYNLGTLVSDFDNDGWPDIYVACDSTPNILYRNNGDGTFADVAVTAGVAYGEDGQAQGGMGAAAADYDNNGWLDLVATNFMGETSALYRNTGELFFEDATYLGGMAVNTTFVSWGVQFLDVDQDGWKDILIANGHIYPELEGGKTGEDFRQRKTLYWNLRNGAFRDVTAQAGAALSAPSVSRGMASGDLDGDGVPEIVVSNMNALPAVLKNSGPKGNGILIELIGTKSNRSAIGASVTVVTGQLRQIDEVRSGSSYVSQNDLRLHFGLGAAPAVDQIRIHWPSGTAETYSSVRANQWLTIREGEGIIKRVPFLTSAGPSGAN